MARKDAGSAPVEVEVAQRGDRAIVEDTSAVGIPGESPDAVYAELTAAREAANRNIPLAAPVEIQADMPAPPQARLSEAEFQTHGGRVDGDGVLLFGEKAFHSDPDKRRSMPRKMNLAAGPRLTQLPQPGEFLKDTKSFRGVPFRTTPHGHIRVDW